MVPGGIDLEVERPLHLRVVPMEVAATETPVRPARLEPSEPPRHSSSGLLRGLSDDKVRCEVYRPVDMAVALVVLLGAFLATNLHSMPGGMEEFILVRLTPRNLLLLGAFVIVWPIIFTLFGLYDPRQLRSSREEALRLLGACTVLSASTTLLLLAGTTDTFHLHTIGIFWLFATGGTLGARHLVRFVLTASRARTRHRVIIVGSGPRAYRLYQGLVADQGAGCDVVGFVDSNDRILFEDVEERMLGGLDDLERILMHVVVDEVLIALPIRSQYEEIQNAIHVCERVGVESKYLADVFRSSLPKQQQVEQTMRAPVVAHKVADDDLRLVVKRGMDVMGALAGLIVLAPLLISIALAIKLTSPGPIFFVQSRYGYKKRLFHMYKFRTMVPDAEALQTALEHLNEVHGPVFKIKDDPRITRIGRFLRRTSLDELPQLINVLRGDMSLVGPRPLPTRDVRNFSEAWLMRRFSVRPGLTCLWQISGRSNLGFDDWVSLDLQYIDQWSLTQDLKILLRTFPAVLRGTGAT